MAEKRKKERRCAMQQSNKRRRTGWKNGGERVAAMTVRAGCFVSPRKEQRAYTHTQQKNN